MAGDDTLLKGGHSAEPSLDRIERWIAGEGRAVAPDLVPVLSALRDRLDELLSIATVRDDPVCRELVEKMTGAPDMVALNRLVEEMEIRVRGVLAASSKTTARRPAAPPRRFLKL